ncbi:hypothetical protein MCHI_003418 [Candidatus Magnetoovum chiemensis]|nr:hypothetical protein MCHI_003418 [Candidatus Magnetoovum chiemensis]
MGDEPAPRDRNPSQAGPTNKLDYRGKRCASPNTKGKVIAAPTVDIEMRQATSGAFPPMRAARI